MGLHSLQYTKPRMPPSYDGPANERGLGSEPLARLAVLCAGDLPSHRAHHPALCPTEGGAPTSPTRTPREPPGPTRSACRREVGIGQNNSCGESDEYDADCNAVPAAASAGGAFDRVPHVVTTGKPQETDRADSRSRLIYVGTVLTSWPSQPTTVAPAQPKSRRICQATGCCCCAHPNGTAGTVESRCETPHR